MFLGWENINTLFSYFTRPCRDPQSDLYGPLSDVIRKAVKKWKPVFDRRLREEVDLPNDPGCGKRRTMPIWNWKLALNRFMSEFEVRLADYI